MWSFGSYHREILVLLQKLVRKRKKYNSFSAVWSNDYTALFCSTKLDYICFPFPFSSKSSQKSKQIRAPPFRFEFDFKNSN